MKKQSLLVLMLFIGLIGCTTDTTIGHPPKETGSQAYIDALFKQEKTLKELAATKSSPPKSLTRTYPGRGTSISTPTTKAALWGGGHEITMSLLKTDVIDRRYIDREHVTMDDVMAGAYSEANKVMCMRRNVTVLGLSCEGLSAPVSFRIYRNRDQGHRRYKNADGSYKKVIQYEPADPNTPVSYYDFHADSEINWTVAAFRGFLARGGFEVSAAHDGKNGIQAVVIKARRDTPLQLMNPWISQHPTVTDLTTGKPVTYTLNTSNGECIVFNAQAGHSYSFDQHALSIKN